MESELMNMIVKNVKIHKIVFVELTFMGSGCNYFKNAKIIVERMGRSLFVFIITIRT
jgi:hypothetical protein